MATTRKTTTGKATKKRGSAAEMKLSFTLDPKRIEQIQRCLKKGRLTITVSKVSAAGRAVNAYIYD
jgi:hypothetical protein